MKVMPTESGSAATWHFGFEGLAFAAVWTEKKSGHGEDAPPTALFHRGSRRGIMAVYDGAGGAGARAVARTPDEQEASGAFVASRAARFAVEDWFVTTTPKRRFDDPCDVHEALADGLTRTGIGPSGKISGTMVRHLPTTVAAIEYQIVKDRVDLAARWAGDSRAYILHPAMGLQAISRDDTQDSDALILLENDQPMTNLVSADRPFHVNEFTGAGPLRLPVVLVCATDGFYNYVPTPAHFEFLLLDTLQLANGTAEWAQALADRVQDYTADDASLVIAALGYKTYQAMRHGFKDRHQRLAHEYVHPFNQVRESGNHAAIVAKRTEQWARYREEYEKWIRSMGDER